MHRLNHDIESGYDEGLIIKIFGKQIYNNVSTNKKEIDENQETNKNFIKTVDNTTIEMDIPDEWQYEELPKDDFYKYALKLYKSQDDKNTILYFYRGPFTCCGTGRTNGYLILNNGEKATVGYYENTEWSDISFYDLNPNIAFINNGLTSDEAKEVLEFVKTITIR